MMRDTSQVYIISVAVIISSFCTPEFIKGPELKT